VRLPALQQRVAAAIHEAAARVLINRGEQASMSDVAAAAGVARATVYRYFPSRQALLDELGEVALREAGARLSSARVDQLPTEEGVERAVRALVEAGDGFVVLARERIRPDPEQFEESLAAPLRRLFERGQSTGQIRGDVPSSWLTESLFGLVVSALASQPARGRDDTIDAITSLFLNGARPDRLAASERSTAWTESQRP
jgi:TetR/AcrR family transcriptional repressor of mexCD-oprJ operon